MWIMLLKSKDEALEAFKKMKARTELEVDLKIKSLETDHGGEFTSNEFAAFYEKNSIRSFLTAPYTPQ